MTALLRRSKPHGGNHAECCLGRARGARRAVAEHETSSRVDSLTGGDAATSASRWSRAPGHAVQGRALLALPGKGCARRRLRCRRRAAALAEVAHVGLDVIMCSGWTATARATRSSRATPPWTLRTTCSSGHRRSSRGLADVRAGRDSCPSSAARRDDLASPAIGSVGGPRGCGGPF